MKKSKIISFIITLMVLLGVLSGSVYAAWTPITGNNWRNIKYIIEPPVPPAEHPRLYISASEIPALKTKLQDSFFSKQLADIETESNWIVANIPIWEATKKEQEYLLTKASARAFKALIADSATKATASQNAYTALTDFFTYIDTRNMFTVDTWYDDYYAKAHFAGAILENASLVYDWCYYDLTPAQRTNLIAKMKGYAQYLEFGYPPNPNDIIGFGGHFVERFYYNSLLSAGIAAYGEDNDMYYYAAEPIVNIMAPTSNYTTYSGMHNQGVSYGPLARGIAEIRSDILFTKMGYPNVFFGNENLFNWLLYLRRPDGQLMHGGDVFDVDKPHFYYWPELPPTFATMAITNNPYQKYEFNRTFTANGKDLSYTGISSALLLVSYNLSAPSTSFETLPLTKYFGSPSGSMIARTGWDAGTMVDKTASSSTVVADMKIGEVQFAGHEHFDGGSFSIYYKGILALDSGVYDSFGQPHDAYYSKRTVAHNTMLIEDPNEKNYTTYTAKFEKEIYDGGQRNYNTIPGDMGDLFNQRAKFKSGEVTSVDIEGDKTDPDYSLLKGNISAAYADTKVEDFDRSFVFLNLKETGVPAALVVYDNVTSVNPSFKKKWLLHSINEPVVSGNVTTITRTQSYSQIFGTSNPLAGVYNGKLVNTTLLPLEDDMSIQKVGGTDKEFFVNDGPAVTAKKGTTMINYAAGATNYQSWLGYYEGDEEVKVGSKNVAVPSEESGDWRIELSPIAPSKNNTFLNVLQMTDATNNSIYTADYYGNDYVNGVMIKDRVVLFSKNSKDISSSFEFDIPTGSYKVLVTDVAAGRWKLYKDGAFVRDITVTEDKNTVYFQGNAGLYRLVALDNYETEFNYTFEVSELGNPPYMMDTKKDIEYLLNASGNMINGLGLPKPTTNNFAAGIPDNGDRVTVEIDPLNSNNRVMKIASNALGGGNSIEIRNYKASLFGVNDINISYKFMTTDMSKGNFAFMLERDAADGAGNVKLLSTNGSSLLLYGDVSSGATITNNAWQNVRIAIDEINTTTATATYYLNDNNIGSATIDLATLLPNKSRITVRALSTFSNSGVNHYYDDMKVSKLNFVSATDADVATPKLYKDGVQITKAVSGSLSLKIPVTNRTGLSYNMKAFVAIYELNALKTLRLMDINVENGFSGEKNVDLGNLTVGSSAQLKVIIVKDTVSLSPLIPFTLF